MPAAGRGILVIGSICAKAPRKAELDATKKVGLALEEDPAQKFLIEPETEGGKFLLEIGEDVPAPAPEKEICELLLPSMEERPSVRSIGTEASTFCPIVLLPLILIRQAGIGLADLLETLLCPFVPRIAIGVELKG